MWSSLAKPFSLQMEWRVSSIGILTNVNSVVAGNRVANSSRNLAKSMMRMSSGMRVNSAADDAAGMAIATGLKATTRSIQQAQRNANDGVAMLQTAESAYGNVSDILIRMRELAVQAGNDTLTDTDRGFLDTEYQNLISEVDRISAVTEYNGINLLDGTAGDGSGAVTFQIGSANDSNAQLQVTLSQVDSTAVKVNGGDITSLANAQTALDNIDAGLEAVSTERSTVGAAVNQLTWASESLGTTNENLSQALSNVRDVDIAAESAAFTSNQVIMQAGVSMLAQANQLPNLALRLIG